jgi:hypothetical protein
MSNREQWGKARDVLRKYAEQLATLPYNEIAQWPEWPEIPSIDLGPLKEFKEFKVTPMKDTLANGTVRVAVQMYKHHFLGVGSLTADGFLIDPNGSIRWLREEDLWDVT